MKFRMMVLLAGALLPGLAGLLLPGMAWAGDGLTALHAFLQDTHTMQAGFEQTVQDRNGKVTQQASGEMQFERPGKFRWVYAKPYPQTLVGDGHKLWMYDPELDQVTVRTLDTAIGTSPAALLAGQVAIEKAYTLADEGTRDGLDWVRAVPRQADAGFKRVELGFQTGMLERMRMQDNFGQTTDIRFEHPMRNVAIAAGTFRFRPPQGADVIGE